MIVLPFFLHSIIISDDQDGGDREAQSLHTPEESRYLHHSVWIKKDKGVSGGRTLQTLQENEGQYLEETETNESLFCQCWNGKAVEEPQS